jgi:hypothetical protein
MMRRVQLESESREMARLIAIGILTIFLYLGLSFSNAYGYQISNFNRFQLESPEKIDWNSDSWLSSNLVFSPSFTPYGETANGGKYFELMDDGYSEGGDVVPSVPEPAITVLLGLGLGTMALYRKLKR